MLVQDVTLDPASSSNDAREIFALKPQHNVTGQLAIPADRTGSHGGGIY